MINILGKGAEKEDEEEVKMLMTKHSLSIPGASLHWYGKGKPTKGKLWIFIT